MVGFRGINIVWQVVWIGGYFAGHFIEIEKEQKAIYPDISRYISKVK